MKSLRIVSLLLAATVAISCSGRDTPQPPPEPEELSVSTQFALIDLAPQTRVITAWTLPANDGNGALDSIAVQTSFGTFPLIRHVKLATATRDTAFFAGPGLGESMTGNVTVFTYRRKQSDSVTAGFGPINVPDVAAPKVTGVSAAATFTP